MAELSGRNALVTGGTRGIGWATARALAAGGAAVALTGRDGATAESRGEQLNAEHAGRTLGFAADAAEFAEAAKAVKRVVDQFGGLDIVVVNAGIMETGLLGTIRPDQVQRLLATNITGAVATVQAAVRVMARRRAGSIVLLSSVVGRYGAGGQSVYAASKAAVASLACSAAREWGPRGIRVNAVAPGLIDTDLIKDLPTDLSSEHVGRTPLGRLGAADEVAEVIRFLASDRAAFVTGQVIGVDGGFTP